MATNAPLTPIRLVDDSIDAPFRVRVRVEGGVVEVAVEGDVDSDSVPVLLEEIRHTVYLIEEVRAQSAHPPELSRSLKLDLTAVDRLETHAVNKLMALVHELEAADMAVGIARRA